MMKKRMIIGLLGALLIGAGLTPLYSPDSYANGSWPSPQPPTAKVQSTKQEPLPTVGSYDNFVKLMKLVKEREKAYGMRYAKAEASMAADGAVENAPMADAKSDTAGSNDFSATNVQVKGVDEADVIKTDGTYLYHATEHQVIISQAYPADSMKIVKQIRYDGENFRPTELYVDEKYLVVIGAKEAKAYSQKPQFGYMDSMPTVAALVYDISNKEKIVKLRELELDGFYISSRKIGSSLYLISSRYVDAYPILEERNHQVQPMYFDSAVSDQYLSVSYTDMRYFPDRVEPSFLMVGAVNLDEKKPMQVSTYLGTGENVYASPRHLYVTVTKWEEDKQVKAMNGREIFRPSAPVNQSSSIYKFDLEPGEVRYLGKGEVPGTILNQFSLDEHQEYLRIATTSGDLWRNDEHTSKNNLYVLDQNLEIKGKLEGIAPGERIYSARFMGNRAYMVTFKKVDPLFVIDLKQPEQPKILGALKIPGYSDYLHPYDENHVIGFGKDTMEAKNQSGNFAWYQGMKVALFDVTDVTRPKEKFKEIIGDRGTDSELLSNHKALLFSKDKHLLAFPVTEMKIREQRNNLDTALSEMPAYGEFSFQGAYIYSLDLEKGFQLRKKITHLTAEQQAKAGHEWYDSRDNVRRILYIEDTLYTFSQGMIKAFDMKDLKELNQLRFPE